LEGKRLFYARKDGVLDDEQHLAEMISLMGNPPPEFLQRSDICARFFDDAGELSLSQHNFHITNAI
jgi:hypothetical protein